MLRPIILLALILVPGFALAATFDVTATCDQTKLELGETAHYTLRLSLHGRSEFPPALEQPKFPGFEVLGPNQANYITQANGDVTVEYVWTWELTAVQAGKLPLGPFYVKGKDPLHGDVTKYTPALFITVAKAKKLAIQLPDAVPTPALEDQELRGIKPDRPLPLKLLLAGLGLFVAVLTGLAWWALRPPRPKPAEPLLREPGAYALQELERLRRECQPGGEAAYALQVAALLRLYLRQRLGLQTETTLAEALRTALRRVKALQPQDTLALRQRLELLLYGDAAPQVGDVDALYGWTRELVLATERNFKDQSPAAADRPRRGANNRKR